MKKSLIVLIVCVLVLARCSNNVSPTQTPILPTIAPTFTSTPIPPLAAPLTPTYIDGYGDIPIGKYLFVEYWITTEGKEAKKGQCEPIAIDEPTYSFDTKTRLLKGAFNWDVKKKPQTIKGFFGFGRDATGKAGIGIQSYLEPITGLPHYQGEYPNDLVINGVDASGKIVVQIGEQIEILEPNKSWNSVETSTNEQGCEFTTALRFTNFGLLNKDQVDLK